MGNILTQVYKQGTGTQKTATYGYDHLNRLVSFSLPIDSKSQSFVYDINGNITSKVTNGSTLTYTYPYLPSNPNAARPNRLTSTSGTGGMSYTYNRNGAMIGRGSNTLAYDYRGLTNGYNSVAYTIDTQGNRVKKVDGSTTTYYIRGPACDEGRQGGRRGAGGIRWNGGA